MKRHRAAPPPTPAQGNATILQNGQNASPAGQTKPPSVTTGPASQTALEAKTPAANPSLHRITGALGEIIWSLTCLSVPMIVLTGIFIGLVYGYLVSEDPLTSNDEAIFGERPESYDQSVYYYINYSATRLITVSSWTSTVTSFTSTFVMALVSYPLAKSYLSKSEAGTANELPTTYQFRLIIGLLGGSLGSLWSWLDYSLWRKRTRQTKLLWVTATALLVSVFLSLAILAVDTWLHVTTSTVPYDRLSPILAQPSASYSRILDPYCWNTTYDPASSGQCIGAINPPGNSINFPTASETARTLTNLSSVNAVLSCRLDEKPLAYITTAQRDPSLDFQASTYALGTTCKPSTRACNLQWDSYCTYAGGCIADMVTPAVTYNCGPNLHGDMLNNTGTPFNSSTGISQSPSSTGFFLQLFGKDNFIDPVARYGHNEITISNPFYFATGAQIATTEALADDPEAAQVSDRQSSGFILSCTSTVYELTYNFVNGSVVNGTYTVTNGTLPANIRWTLTNVQAYSQNSLESAWISGAQQSNTSQELADFFALRFSETALGMVVGMTEPASNLAERTRQHLLVARLPKAPFFALIVLNLLYAALGVLLAVLAIASQPRKTRDLQARLSIAGLVAALFEPHHTGAGTPHSKRSDSGIEGVFAEYHQRNHDGARVVVVHAGDGSHVFEKTSSQRLTMSDKSSRGQHTSEEPVVSTTNSEPLQPQVSQHQKNQPGQSLRVNPRNHQSGRSSTY
ncbi:uncharacterized protein A1O9_00412 [Exophiala aquamarina CBS 119918]|uniref:Uncharacterized protein n=1 Tax=Exophiala aquamarina CBS 119918 TaxID=1182545 RepID=A0A072Q3F9_9EURO|nr:uncharacterized protein A1O9_00412 [Exophiala aquamarina CBS 119918]KEF62440.1 hypothetical protein A1O9_00412 [Exophiala aquamarina CBS 119918]